MKAVVQSDIVSHHAMNGPYNQI